MSQDRIISDLAGTKKTTFKIGSSYVEPTLDQEAAPKKYVDSKVGNYVQSFTNSDLVSSILTVSHYLGSSPVNVVIMDNNNKFIPIDDSAITFTNINQFTIDFTAQGTLTGTWKLLCSQGGGVSGSSGGEWELVERWEPKSACSTYTFSGLNGDTDRRYKLQIRGMTTGTGTILAQLNGTTSTYSFRLFNATGSSVSTSTDTKTGCLLCTVDSSDGVVSATAIIDAKSGCHRLVKSDWIRVNSSDTLDVISSYSTTWSDTTSNITSIVMGLDAAYNFAVGTCIELYRLKDSTSSPGGSRGSDGSTRVLTMDYTMTAAEVGTHYQYSAATSAAKTFNMCVPPNNNSAPVWIKNLSTSYSMSIVGHINGTAASTFALQSDSEIKLISEGQTWRIVMERWTPSSAASSHTFAGLDGNTDVRHRFIGNIVAANSQTGDVPIQANGQSSTYIGAWCGYDNGTSTGSTTGWAGFNVAGIVSDVVSSGFEGTINAKTGADRYYMGTQTRINSSTYRAIYTSTSCWLDSTTNITSYTISFGTNGIGVGSYVELWKTGELR